jgi:hypothetical protein
MENLKSLLASQGVVFAKVTSLREIVNGHERFGDLPLTRIERDHPFQVLATTPKRAISLWRQLREISDVTNSYPVILGDVQEMGYHLEHWQYVTSAPLDYLKRAQFRDPKQIFNEWGSSLFAYERTEDGLRELWPDKIRPYTFDMLHLNLKAELVYIGLFETRESWKIPAYLLFGGWNATPFPDEHACIHKYWHTIYETEIVAMTSNTIVCQVGKPVDTREAALDLAREQMAYCSDLVTQGVGTLEALASRLMNSAYWYFWWD